MTDATSIDPTQMLSGMLSDPAATLFGLEDEFSVLSVQRTAPAAVSVVVEQMAREGPCPDCGVLSSVIKDRPLRRVKDLPASGQRVELWWRKRRLVCSETLCPRRSFTQTAEAVRPRARVSERLRDKVASAIATSNRSVTDVAGEYGVSWPTAHKALVVAAARWLPEPEPTTVLGIDETRFRSVRWILDDGVTWRRSDPWLTSFVDCTPGRPGVLLGLAPGRTGACVRDWLGVQSDAFRREIAIVVIDPSAPYASGIRAALPGVTIAVDKWHLVALANAMVTEVRQRVTRTLLGRRGTTRDLIWLNRRLLLTGAEHLSAKQRTRLWRSFDLCDPTKEVQAAWAVKERLRLLLAESEPSRIRRRLADFYEAAVDAHLPEATRLAGTISTWWPAVLVALTHAVTNARTEGFNRIIKQTKRVGCGYRNMDNYQRRILSHIAVTRPQKSAA
jgi:transposase